MPDQPRQSEAIDADSAPPTELAARLLSRHTRPVGVIDAHHPQQLHSRTAGWVAERFNMLDHWRTRYGGGEQAPSAGTDLSLASAPARSLQRSADAIPGASPVPLGAGTASPIAITPAPAALVIRRAARQPLIAQPTSGPSPNVMERGTGPDVADGEAPKPADTGALNRPPVPADNDGDPAPALFKMRAPSLSGGMRGSNEGGQRGEAAKPLVISQAETPVSASPALRLQRKPATDQSGLTQARVVESPAPSPAKLDLTWPRTGAEKVPPPAIAESAKKPPALMRSEDPTAPAPRGTHTPSVSGKTPDHGFAADSRQATGARLKSSVELPVQVSAMPLLQRKPATVEPVAPRGRVIDSSSGPAQQMPGVKSGASASTTHMSDGEGDVGGDSRGNAGGNGPTRPATHATARVVAEAPAISAALPHMIWRKESGGSGAHAEALTGDRRTASPWPSQEVGTLSRPATPMLARQVSSGRQASENQAGTAAAMPGGTEAGGPTTASATAHPANVEQIAEQVSRLLAREFAIERERRGRR